MTVVNVSNYTRYIYFTEKSKVICLVLSLSRPLKVQRDFFLYKSSNFNWGKVLLLWF